MWPPWAALELAVDGDSQFLVPKQTSASVYLVAFLPVEMVWNSWPQLIHMSLPSPVASELGFDTSTKARNYTRTPHQTVILGEPQAPPSGWCCVVTAVAKHACAGALRSMGPTTFRSCLQNQESGSFHSFLRSLPSGGLSVVLSRFSSPGLIRPASDRTVKDPVVPTHLPLNLEEFTSLQAQRLKQTSHAEHPSYTSCQVQV